MPASVPRPNVWVKPQTLALLVALDDLQNTLEVLLDPRHELSGLAAVSPDEGETREHGLDFCQNQFGTISVQNVGAMDDDRQKQARVSTMMGRLRPLIFLPAS